MILKYNTCFQRVFLGYTILPLDKCKKYQQEDSILYNCISQSFAHSTDHHFLPKSKAHRQRFIDEFFPQRMPFFTHSLRDFETLSHGAQPLDPLDPHPRPEDDPTLHFDMGTLSGDVREKQPGSSEKNWLVVNVS